MHLHNRPLLPTETGWNGNENLRYGIDRYPLPSEQYDLENLHSSLEQHDTFRSECIDMADQLHRFLTIWQQIIHERERREYERFTLIMEMTSIAIATVFGARAAYVQALKHVKKRIDRHFTQEQYLHSSIERIADKDLLAHEKAIADKTWEVIFHINDILGEHEYMAQNIFESAGVPVQINGMYWSVDMSLLSDYQVIPGVRENAKIPAEPAPCD